MPKRSRKRRPRDPNALAKAIVDEATGNATPDEDEEPKNIAAVTLGRLGGLKGGKVRAKRMTKKQRSEAASKAAKARWRKYRKEQKLNAENERSNTT